MVSIGVHNLGSGHTYGYKAKAQPGTSFANEPTVTASDSTNAARLGPLGYVAIPTSNWTTGQKITVNGFVFNWNGSTWVAGAHASDSPNQTPTGFTYIRSGAEREAEVEVAPPGGRAGRA